MRDQKAYDFNYLLKLGNIFIFSLTLLLYNNLGGNNYINGYTLILMGIFCTENLFILYYEKKARNPFIIIMQVVSLFFYVVRIPGLLLYPDATILFFFTVTSKDINFALGIIILMNPSIILGFAIAKIPNLHQFRKITFEGNINVKIFILLYSIVLIVSFPSATIDLGLDGVIFGYFIRMFFNYITFIIIVLTILLLKKDLSISESLLLKTLILLYIIIHSLAGGRGTGIELTATILFLSLLATRGQVLITRKHCLLLILIMPLVYNIISFGYFSRIYKRANPGKNNIEQFNAWVADPIYRDPKIISPFLFSRLGYFDHTVRVITNNEKYSRVINPIYYSKSIIDNVLTPGINFFDVPLANLTLKFIDRGVFSPTMKTSIDDYSSTIISLYAESYVMFGIFGSLIMLVITSIIFQTLYYLVSNLNIFTTSLYRTGLLFLFYNHFITFGVDWDSRIIISTFVPISLFVFFFVKRGKQIQRDTLFNKETIPS